MATKQIGTIETFVTVDYNELDNLIHEVYPDMKDYEFAPYEEAANGSSHEFNVTGKIDKNTQNRINNGFWHYSAGAILDKLCLDGYISPGKYLVRVSW